MAELSDSKLEPDLHMLLDQPMLRLPHEVLKKNLKSAQRHIEITNKNVTTAIQTSMKQPAADALASLDATLQKAQNLKRKLMALQTEEHSLHNQQKARIRHLERLHDIPTLEDVKYEAWSHARLDRLLIDYFLRNGYTETAQKLAREKNIEDLVDVDVFRECGRIERSLRAGRTQECLAWCVENKQALRKMNSNLELELRLQQFIELARSGDTKQLVEAIVHARKHLAAGQDTDFGLRAGGLLANPPDTVVEPYKQLYSGDRYEQLASQFLITHHELFSLPSQPLLHIALSAGVSALKTPLCHSIHTLQTSVTGAPECPICSVELNELARTAPYAHRTKSHIEDDPVVLPNGHVYGRERLRALNEKMGTKQGRFRDPADPQSSEWGEWEVKKVFIS